MQIDNKSQNSITIPSVEDQLPQIPQTTNNAHQVQLSANELPLTFTDLQTIVAPNVHLLQVQIQEPDLANTTPQTKQFTLKHDEFQYFVKDGQVNSLNDKSHAREFQAPPAGQKNPVLAPVACETAGTQKKMTKISVQQTSQKHCVSEFELNITDDDFAQVQNISQALLNQKGVPQSTELILPNQKAHAAANFKENDVRTEVEDQKSQQIKQNKSELKDSQDSAEEQNFDPGEGLDFLDQVLARDRIRYTVVTPFDQRQRLQYFENPKIPDHFVSVDLYNLNLQPYYKAATETPKYNRPTCQSDHKLVCRPLPEEKQKDECDCLPENKKWRSANKGWTCTEKECEHKRWVCSQCGTDYFVRWKLTEKTANHHFYTTLAIKNDQNASFNQGEFYDTKNIQDTKADDSQTFVLIRFWKKINDQMACYSQIKIDRPYIFTKSQNFNFYSEDQRIVPDKFLAVGPNKEALYFCYQKKTQTSELSYEIKLNFFDLIQNDQSKITSDPRLNEQRQYLINKIEQNMSNDSEKLEEKLINLIKDNGGEFIENNNSSDQKYETDFVVDYPVLIYADCFSVQQKVMVANLGIDCPQIQINIHPYKFFHFVKDRNRNIISYCKNDKNESDDLDQQGCAAFLVQHENETEIGLMISKFYLWRKPGDSDYESPKIMLLKKDLFEQVKVSKIVEAVRVGKAILVQYIDSNQDFQLVAAYMDGQKPQSLRPIDQNQKFGNVKMIVSDQNAFIMAVNKEKKQTLCAIYYDSQVKLQNIWNSTDYGGEITQMSIQHGTDTKEDQLSIYFATEFYFSIASFVQKNNHFSFKDEKQIDGYSNADTLEHPQVFWMDIDLCKPKSFLALGYLKDKDRGYKELYKPTDERVVHDLQPQIISLNSKQIQIFIEGSQNYFRTTNQVQTRTISLIRDLSIQTVSFLKNQIILQTEKFGLLHFDSQTLLLRNRKPQIKDTIVLTFEPEDGCQYVCHNEEVYKYQDNESYLVYKQTCLLKYKDKVNEIQYSLFHDEPHQLFYFNNIKLTIKGTIVTVITIQDKNFKEASIVQKIEYSCDCDNCNNFEIYIIIQRSEVKEFCVTENYLVVILDNTVNFIPLLSIQVRPYTNLEELKKINPLLFTTITELDKPITHLVQVSANSLFMFPQVKQNRDFIQFESGDKKNEPDVTYIWDLQALKPVESLEQPNQFNGVQSFAQTGFQIFSRPYSNFENIRHNKNQTLYSIETHLFKTYTEKQLLQIQQLQQQSQHSQEILDQNDFVETALANIEGHTLFSICLSKQNWELLNLVQERLSNKDANLTAIQIRRLYQNLKKPFIFDNDSKLLQQHHLQNEYIQQWSKRSLIEGCFDDPIDNKKEQIQESKSEEQIELYKDDWDYQKNKRRVDSIISLFELCPEKNLSDVVTSMEVLLQKFEIPKSSQLVKFMQSGTFIHQGKEVFSIIEDVQWDESFPRIFFGSDTCKLSEKEIKYRVAQKQKQKQFFAELQSKYKCLQKLKQLLKPIIDFLKFSDERVPKDLKIKIVDVSFMKQNSIQLQDMYLYLATTNDENVYEDELVKLLLQIQDYSNQITIKVFLPYLVYMISVLYYLTVIIPDTKRDLGFFNGSSANIALRSIILIFTVLLVGLELRQFQLKRWEHIKDIWSQLQFSSYIFNIAIIGIHSSEQEINNENLIQAASFSAFIQWVLMLYWIRMSPKLSFYVDIVKSSIIDIRYFLMMLVLMIMTFSNALFILDQRTKNEEGENYQSFIVDVNGNSFVSLFIQQLLLGLGNVPTDNIAENQFRYLIWFYFLAAVIVTNVAFFNILIAIVSDSYQRIMESQERSHLIQQVEITSEFIDFITFDAKITACRYLYFIEPAIDDSSIQGWEGGLKLIKKNLKRQEEKISENLNQLKEDFKTHFSSISKMDAKTNAIEIKIDTIQTSIDAQSKEIETKMDSKIGSIETKIDTLTAQLAEILNALKK